MDNKQNLPSPELPKPQLQESHNSLGNKPEFGNYSPELKVQPMPGEAIRQANSAVSQAATAQDPIAIFSNQGASAQGTASDPVIADDNDVIEKEWVDKAKNIVARTQGDPKLQSDELNKLKRDYISKRYGKLIKVPDDQARAA